MRHYTYQIAWSEEDQEYVGRCIEFPSLSWCEADKLAAFQGIVSLVEKIVAGLLGFSEFRQSENPPPDRWQEGNSDGN